MKTLARLGILLIAMAVVTLALLPMGSSESANTMRAKWAEQEAEKEAKREAARAAAEAKRAANPTPPPAKTTSGDAAKPPQRRGRPWWGAFMKEGMLLGIPLVITAALAGLGRAWQRRRRAKS